MFVHDVPVLFDQTRSIHSEATDHGISSQGTVQMMNHLVILNYMLRVSLLCKL